VRNTFTKLIAKVVDHRRSTYFWTYIRTLSPWKLRIRVQNASFTDKGN